MLDARVPEKDSDWPTWVTCSNLDQSLRSQGWDTVIDPSGSCAEVDDGEVSSFQREDALDECSCLSSPRCVAL